MVLPAKLIPSNDYHERYHERYHESYHERYYEWDTNMGDRRYLRIFDSGRATIICCPYLGRSAQVTTNPSCAW